MAIAIVECIKGWIDYVDVGGSLEKNVCILVWVDMDKHDVDCIESVVWKI